MKKLLVTLLVAASLLPTAAYADPPTIVSGHYTVQDFQVLDQREAGGNTIATYRLTLAVTGDITGTEIATQYSVIHADGSQNIHGYFTCYCQLLGEPFESVGNFAAAGDPDGFVSGTFQIRGDTATGHGQFSVPGSVANYQIVMHFTP